MANLHKLANRPRLARLTAVEPLVAASLDGANARTDAIARLDRLHSALDVEHTVIDALDYRRLLRPAVPNQGTLPDLVRTARRRLEQERIAGRRGSHTTRLAAMLHLRGVLTS